MVFPKANLTYLPAEVYKYTTQSTRIVGAIVPYALLGLAPFPAPLVLGLSTPCIRSATKFLCINASMQSNPSYPSFSHEFQKTLTTTIPMNHCTSPWLLGRWRNLQAKGTRHKLSLHRSRVDQFRRGCSGGNTNYFDLSNRHSYGCQG